LAVLPNSFRCLTNGVSAFQRIIDECIDHQKLDATYAYLDNVTVCGRTQEEHDRNVQKFYEFVDQYNLTLNHDKSVIAVQEINMLGYLISYGKLKPDPERIEPLH
jgi:hypothetical protein